MRPYPKTFGEARSRIREFVRDLGDEHLGGVAIELLDHLPRSTADDMLNAALELLGGDSRDAHPEAARDLIAQALDFAFLEGADLGRAAHTFIEKGATRHRGVNLDPTAPQRGEPQHRNVVLDPLEAAAQAYAAALDEDRIVQTVRALSGRFCTERVRRRLDAAILLVNAPFFGAPQAEAARSLTRRALYHAAKYAPCSREREEALEVLKPHLPG